MIYKPYDIYRTFKTVEGRVKDKKTRIATEDKYDSRMSDKNKELLQEISNLFNTKFQNVELEGYIECGFEHFKGFSYDKFFREIVLSEYIARDSRKKRKSTDTLPDILKSLKYIDRDLNKYVNERIEEHRVILDDYIRNRVCSTVVVYCIWRGLWNPDGVEWEYMNVIQGNYSDFEKNVVKFAPMLDKWRKSMKGK